MYGVSASSQCPINKLGIVPYNKTITEIRNYPKNYNLEFGESSRMNWVTNDTGGSPLVGLYLGLSRPCANNRQTYVKRLNSTTDVYVDELDTCSYEDGIGNKMNLQYSPSGYGTPELKIYKANNLYTTIKNWVPAFSDDGLKAANYSLYYKTYSLWKQRCQLVYSTESVAAEGKKIGTASQY